MEHTLEVLVELDVDGVPVAGFPFRHTSRVNYVEPFTSQNFGDSGFTRPGSSVGPTSELHVLFITADQDFAVKLNGEPTVTYAPFCGGFVLVVNGTINTSPWLTAKATNVVPAILWGVVAGTQV